MDSSQTQQLFFNHIKSKLPQHLSFVDEVAELLNISNDSAYRRIRGEKPIGLDEVQLLCNKYQVSLDQLLQIESNTVIFSGNRFDKVSYGVYEYLQDICGKLELFKMLEQPHVYYHTKDTAIFHFMQFPELSAFKFFFWKRTLVGYPELAKQQFNGEETNKDILEIAKKIIENYIKLPSTEIWCEESINITIKQIEFYRQSNVFTSKQVVTKIYLQLEELLNHVELQAEAGKKFLYNQPVTAGSASYNMYINECLIGDNSIFVKGGDRQITFLNHNGLNFMGTEDISFCDYTFNNLQNLIKKSSHISVIGEKERSIFFNTLREKIYKCKKDL